MDMLKVSGVSKQFGSRKIIDDLSFAVPQNCIYGFIGENGAGKTTTMKMILGLYTIDSGEIYVNGEKVVYGQNKTNKYIGYLPDVPEFYNFMTPKEYMQMCADMTGMSKNESKKRIDELLELVGLEKHNKRIKGFSRGMKQRLGIAQAMINSPRLLICDEPTSALDPLGRKEILDILEKAKAQTTIIFSTHILSDVERICDEIGLLHKGKIACSGKLEDVLETGNGRGFEIEFINVEDAKRFWQIMYKEWANEITEQKKISLDSGVHLICEGRREEEMLHAMELLVHMGIPVRRVQMCEPSLEKIFMEVIAK